MTRVFSFCCSLQWLNTVIANQTGDEGFQSKRGGRGGSEEEEEIKVKSVNDKNE